MKRLILGLLLLTACSNIETVEATVEEKDGEIYFTGEGETFQIEPEEKIHLDVYEQLEEGDEVTIRLSNNKVVSIREGGA